MEKHTWNHKGRSFDDGVYSMDALYNQNREIRKAWHNGKVIWDSSKIQDTAWVSFKLPFLYTFDYITLGYTNSGSIVRTRRRIKANRIVLELKCEITGIIGDPIILSHGIGQLEFKMKFHPITNKGETIISPYFTTVQSDFSSGKNYYTINLKTTNTGCDITIRETYIMYFYYDNAYMGAVKKEDKKEDFNLPKPNARYKSGVAISAIMFNSKEVSTITGSSALWLPFHYYFGFMDGATSETSSYILEATPTNVENGPRVGVFATADDTMYLSTQEELSNFKCSPNATFEFE